MDDIKIEVQKHYAAIATQVDGCGCGSGSSCCSSDTVAASDLIDYGDLNAEVVEGANLGLGCGIPTLHAGIRPGDTVLDLGSGAGVDVFLAAKAVGPEGRVIGVDMTPEMIARAWNNALNGGYRNVEFRLGDIEALPVEPTSVDVILSNCVINLVPDKRRVFAEMYRVLKPGGHFSISDMVTYGHVPDEIRNDVDRWTGCIAGAMDRDTYVQIIREAGFADVRVDKSIEYDALKGEGYGVTSITVEGRKA